MGLKCLLCLIFVILVTEIEGRKPIDDSYKLPKSIKPIRYTLTIEPEVSVNITEPIFSGSVEVELKTLENTNNITLHVRRLNISENSLKVTKSDGSEIKVSNTTVDEDREFYIIYVEEELLEGQYYNLSVGEFSGFLRTDNVGVYIAKYKDKNDQERRIAVTDFEPSDARKAFPCFDEPALKATFIVKLIRPENYATTSNEELLCTENLGNGKYLDTYKETVLMSTYLVAFLVSDFKHTAKKERHRVFARPEAIDNGELDYALSEGVEILRILEQYTGVNYSLSKMDQVAIPHRYFNDEAMENWGIVTFSEKHLFISNETSKTEDLQKCTAYIAHEFGHQWFGNLVTFKDWKYMWLSEGFGTYLQYFITSLAKPSWRYMDQFVLQILHSIFEYDMTHLHTEPMNYQPIYIGSIPSPWICYFKASTVIRMMEHFLTAPIFRKGLNIYLQKHQFNAVEPADLYNALQQAVDESDANNLLGNHSVTSIMETWDSNLGYPLITVTRNYETESVTISQERYVGNKETNDTSTWYVPISYVSGSSNSNFSDTTADIWLTERNITLHLNVTPNEWILFNKQQSGVYRVNYDVTNWQRLALYLNSDNYDTIHVINRGQLIFDSFHFALLDRIPISIPLNLSKYLIRETDYIAITPFIDAIQDIEKKLVYAETYSILKNYIMKILNTSYDYVGFDEKPTDTNLDKLNRIQLVSYLCYLGHSQCRNAALQKIRNWKESGQLDLTPDLKTTVLCSAMRSAPSDEWEFLYNKAVNDSANKIEYLEALACSEDKKILASLLKRIFNDNITLTSREKGGIVMTVVSSSIGSQTLLQYMLENDDFPQHFYKPQFMFNVAQSLGTQEHITQLEALNRPGTRFAVGVVKHNMEWINQHFKEKFDEWLFNYALEHQDSSNIVD